MLARCLLANSRRLVSFVLEGLLWSFAIERPREPVTFPSWDLDLVSKSLMSEVYEPLESKDLRTLTKKTLFLVALGFGCGF